MIYASCALHACKRRDFAPAGATKGLSDRPLETFGPMRYEIFCKFGNLKFHFSCVCMKIHAFFTSLKWRCRFFEEAPSANQRSSEGVRNGFCKQNRRPVPPAEPADTNESRRGCGPSDASPGFFDSLTARRANCLPKKCVSIATRRQTLARLGDGAAASRCRGGKPQPCRGPGPCRRAAAGVTPRLDP